MIHHLSSFFFSLRSRELSLKTFQQYQSFGINLHRAHLGQFNGVDIGKEIRLQFWKDLKSLIMKG